ncbi:tricarballylate utilization 4Fe-4S protein TcuB [Tianweitania sp. BSSL-BM11]|uniref:Tricarballylate utilization 4Fe-4S protein TcuB n=1 Tax=Tianweitania aestuarii TaxID=2814886 RepID=A0ABS5RXP0_9HYPH|nr:tricarballylate utilization 4Fe-4S protein TcuB [Tianweitania aestuarii]MBS9721815.1 tricarballylate utilization 4Fe-4S protein TcuB [Tianweitania aestuarii]
MHAADHYKEAERLMTICNSCRYCEGLCAVFPAMELRRSYENRDLDYLANLCHGCGACYVDCQFSPPHEFKVNVPRTLAQLRGVSYRSHAWPGFMRPMFDRNGLAIAVVTALSIAGFILGFALWHDPRVLFLGEGQFYRLMPHNVMAPLFGAAFLFSLLALGMGFRSFWCDIGARSVSAGSGGSLLQASRDAAALRYLDGGGVGCYNEDERPTDNRRLFHHLTFYGFLLCFASTSSGTIYHYAFDWPAPYGLLTLPKLFGIPGGIGLVVGSLGLIHAKLVRDRALMDPTKFGMDTAFLLMMLVTGLTGLLLMVLRETPAMGITLAVHLGAVFALFLTMPYGKFVHGIYRFGALALYAAERRLDRAAVPGAKRPS